MTAAVMVALVVFAICLNVWGYRAHRRLDERERNQLGRALGNHPANDWPIGGGRSWQ